MRIGKLDQFPLDDESKRWTKYDDAHGMKTENESCLLVQPWREDPEQYFMYNNEGLIAPKKNLNGLMLSKAQESIRVFALLRMELVNARKDYYTEHVEKRLADIIKYRKAIIGSKDKQMVLSLNTSINDKLKEIAQLTHKDKQYSGMVRYLLKKDLAEALGEDLKKYFPNATA